MSHNITNADIRKLLELVNAERRRCGASSDLELMVWSPGDGWTRYQLFTDEGNSLSRVCTNREMYETLYTLDNLVRFARWR